MDSRSSSGTPDKEVLASGARLGRYEIRAKLGAGGMGEVYLALDSELDRTVAIKVLPEVLASDQQRMKRFIQEARTVSALNHPNILTIHEFGQAESLRFIVTEFVDGVTLREYVSNRRMKLDEVLDIATQVAAALDAAHEANVAHRDIKPENIMVRQRDQIVKVVDFGLAKPLEEVAVAQGPAVDAEAGTKVLLHTEPGLVMGTIGYMSPEQSRGSAGVDHRTDIWSLGVVLYELVTGRLPFEGKDIHRQIIAIQEQEQSPLSTYVEGMPERLEDITRKALTKDPSERYQTAKDLLIDLRHLRKKIEVEAEIERSAPPESAAGTMLDGGQMAAGKASTTLIVAEASQATAASSVVYIVTRIRRHQLTAVVVLAALVLGGVGLTAYLRARNAEVAIGSIAVLPFVNQNNDPDTEYLSDGLTESIINSLASLPNLKVIPRSVAFRYKGKTVDPQKVGDELSVNAVLSGRVNQRGDNLTISVELDDLRYNKQLWGQQYNRKLADLLAVQNQIAGEISQRIRLQITGEERRKLSKGSTENPEAYQLYLKGNYYTSKFTKDGLRKGIDYFYQAIATDPNYALAYNGLAFYYIVACDWFLSPNDSMPKAKDAALKAVAIDDTLADAHLSLALVSHWYDRDWIAAEREFKRAIELNPSDARSHEFYSWLLLDLGRMDEAVAEGKRAVQLDPVSSETNTYLGIDLVFTRQYPQAIDQLRKTVELDSNYWYAHNLLGRAYEASGKLPEAIAEFQRALQLEDTVAENWCNLGHAYALSGKRVEAEKIIGHMKEFSAHDYVPPYNMATIYAGLGDKDQAFAWLDRANQERSDNLVLFIKVDPQMDNLRSDPRLADLVKRIGLPS